MSAFILKVTVNWPNRNCRHQQNMDLL